MQSNTSRVGNGWDDNIVVTKPQDARHGGGEIYAGSAGFTLVFHFAPQHRTNKSLHVIPFAAGGGDDEHLNSVAAIVYSKR